MFNLLNQKALKADIFLFAIFCEMSNSIKMNGFTWNFMVPNKKLFIIQSNSFFINHFIYKHHKYILNPSRKQKKNLLWNVRMMQRMQPYQHGKNVNTRRWLAERLKGRMAEVDCCTWHHHTTARFGDFHFFLLDETKILIFLT